MTLTELLVLTHTCMLGIYPTWRWCMILLIYCWIHFVNILLKILTFMFIRIVVVVHSLSRVWLFVTLWLHQAFLSLTISCSSPKFMSIESVMPPNHLILCHPFLLLLSIFPSISEYFPMSWLFPSGGSKYWSFSFSFGLSNEYSGLISFGIDWFDLLVVQGTLKSLLQHHSLKVSNIWCSAFFMVQLSHLYMTIGKTIALTIQIFVSKVLSLLF